MCETGSWFCYVQGVLSFKNVFKVSSLVLENETCNQL